MFVEICWVPFIPGLPVYSFSCNHRAPLQDRLVNCEASLNVEGVGTQNMSFCYQRLGCVWPRGLMVPDFPSWAHWLATQGHGTQMR